MWVDRNGEMCYNCINTNGTVITHRLRERMGGETLIKLDMKRDTPIYEQIIEQVKYHVIKGNIKTGMAIPSVRKLALDLNITPGTVAKAYQELERQGIIETIRGKGTFIAGKLDRKPDQSKIMCVKKSLEPGLLELKIMGLNEVEVLQLIEDLYRELGD